MEKVDDFCPQAVVLCAGDYPTHARPLGLLDASDKVVCCDGVAMDYVRRRGKAPWRIVGDGDSLSLDFKRRYAMIIRQFSEQDYNDQTKATYYLRGEGITSIAYVGATGGREDHTLGNISLLIDYMRWGLDVRMYTDHGVFIPCKGVFRTSWIPVGSQVSIFSFGAKDFRSEGLRYTLPPLNNWWQGTLNETTRPDVAVLAEGEFLLFVNY